MAECIIISHRGANKIAPQNTLPAFRKSIDFHTDGFETDVHISNDGVPVICHNYTVDKTSDGEGEINDLSLSMLKELDFGSYFHRAYKGTKIPTLDEFLSLCEKAKLKILNIEIKSPLNKDYTVADKVIEAVKKHNLFDILLISSFDYRLLEYIKKIESNCKTGFLYSPNRKIAYDIMGKEPEFAKSIGAEALHPHQILVTKKYVERAHDAGIKVNPWTVNSKFELTRVVKAGVDSVITDVPDFARKIISSL